MEKIKIDITHIPFSRYGAYVSLTKEEHENFLTIHNVRRRFDEGPTLTLGFGSDGNQPFDYEAEPEKIMIKTQDGTATIYIRDDITIVIESDGVEPYFMMPAHNAYGTNIGDKAYRMISVNQRIYASFMIEKGYVVSDGPVEKFRDQGRTFEDLRDRRKNIRVLSEDGGVRMALNITMKEPSLPESPICVQDDLEKISKEWNEFLSKLPELHNTVAVSENFVKVTWYNLWSSFARAEDTYHSDIMLMSKKHMSSVWSWDHCFNALAISKVSKEKALEQFEAPFKLQSPKGHLPDMWNPYTEVVWGVTKPPIHGWCFSKLMDTFEFETEELKRVFTYLEKWTNWWMTEADTNGNGIPAYPQGCDSGWDNSSVFDGGFFIESPDLSAYLVVQMYTLSRIAGTLNQRMDVEKDWSALKEVWCKNAEELANRFYDYCWNGERFAARYSETCEWVDNSTSLITMLPLVLGEYLDKEKRSKLVEILKRDYLTDYGLATEMPASPKYKSDGYWRGPIWAPPTYLMVDGLRRGGELELAAEIAKRYCRMSSEIAKGNYENFDALTGKGLCAPGYTWSTSVFMLLYWEFV